MGLTGTGNQTEVTPYRKTSIHWDLSEPNVSEPPFAITRRGNEIGRGTNEPAGASSSVFLLPVGAWMLEPLHLTQTFVDERSDNFGAVLQDTDWTLATGIVKAPRQRAPADLVGIGAIDANMAASSDNFLQKTVAAGANWNGTDLTADKAAYGQPTYPTQNVQIGRHAVSNAVYQADQGFALRFDVPGTKQHSADVIFGHYFGGPATANGAGQYCIGFHGDGWATLTEKVSGTWTKRDRFLYSKPHRVHDTAHNIWIKPARLMSGQFCIMFFCGETQKAGSPGLTGAVKYLDSVAYQDMHVFYIRAQTVTPARTNATGAGVFRHDGRHDQRHRWQVVLERYPVSGSLIDQPFVLPFPLTKRSSLVITWTADVLAGTSIVGKLYDGTSLTELTSTASTANSRTYTPTFGQSKYYAVFTFTADSGRTISPLLWGYSVYRDGYATTPVSLTPFVGGLAREFNISGPESDPSHETASVIFEDDKNQLATLRARSSIRARIQTQYDSADSSKRSILFDGFGQRNTASRRGTTGRVYPDPKWSRFDCTFIGMWQRLHESLSFVRWPFDSDPTGQVTAYASLNPWQVTKVCRQMLGWAGFTPEQIDIPDNPITFFAATNSEALYIDPLTNIAEFVAGALKNYLGWFLIWDPNAGVTSTPNTTGMWRARPPSISPYTNLAVFTTAGPASGKVATRPESYPNSGGTSTGNWTGTNTNVVKTFIRKRTLVTYVKPPEANFVWVTGTGQLTPDKDGQMALTNWAVNVKSYDFFADSAGNLIQSSDPTNPDYLGRFVPLVIIDPTLGGLGDQTAVDWFVRRYYDFTCHAIKMATFEAPLVLVTDATDVMTGRAGQVNNPRPLRYYDAVQIIDQGVTSQWLVRNCNPTYRKDGVMMARYELESPRI